MIVLHFFHKWFSICNHIRISHYFKELNLCQCLFNLLIVHLGNIDDLHYVLLFALLWLDQDRVTETSLPDYLHLTVFLHSNLIFMNLLTSIIQNTHKRVKYNHYRYYCECFIMMLYFGEWARRNRKGVNGYVGNICIKIQLLINKLIW